MNKLQDFCILFLLLCFYACDSKIEIKEPLPEVEVQFTFESGRLIDQLTQSRNDLVSSTPECYGLDELRLLADQGLLQAYVVLSWEAGSGAIQTHSDTLDVYWVDDLTLPFQGQFMTEVLPLVVGHVFSVTQFVVYDITDVAKPQLLYSALGEESPYAAHAPEETLLPMTIEVEPEQRYTKFSLPMRLYCVANYEPTEFGFVKWGVSFFRLVQLPFAVNVCNAYQEDVVGMGNLVWEYGRWKDGEFVSDGQTYPNISFPDGEHLAKLVYFDDSSSPDEQEIFYYRMYITNVTPVQVYEGYVSVAELNSFKEEDFEASIWDHRFHFLHFWFCSDKSAWFLDTQLEYE